MRADSEIRKNADEVADAVTDIVSCVSSMDKHGTLLGASSREQAQVAEDAQRAVRAVLADLAQLGVTLAGLQELARESQHNCSAVQSALAAEVT